MRHVSLKTITGKERRQTLMQLITETPGTYVPSACYVVRPAGLEPAHPAPEAGALIR
jgi:hypothetical protein